MKSLTSAFLSLGLLGTRRCPEWRGPENCNGATDHSLITCASIHKQLEYAELPIVPPPTSLQCPFGKVPPQELPVLDCGLKQPIQRWCAEVTDFGLPSSMTLVCTQHRDGWSAARLASGLQMHCAPLNEQLLSLSLSPPPSLPLSARPPPLLSLPSFLSLSRTQVCRTLALTCLTDFNRKIILSHWTCAALPRILSSQLLTRCGSHTTPRMGGANCTNCVLRCSAIDCDAKFMLLSRSHQGFLRQRIRTHAPPAASSINDIEHMHKCRPFRFGERTGPTAGLKHITRAMQICACPVQKCIFTLSLQCPSATRGSKPANITMPVEGPGHPKTSWHETGGMSIRGWQI